MRSKYRYFITYREAGFDEVITRTLPFESHYASIDAFPQSTARRLTADVMGQLRKPEQQRLLGGVRQAMSQFEGSHGLMAPAELLLGVGSKVMMPLCARHEGEVIRHFWGSELLDAPTGPGQETRHVDPIIPLWNLFDFTSEGRGTDWMPELSYS